MSVELRGLKRRNGLEGGVFGRMEGLGKLGFSIFRLSLKNLNVKLEK